VRYSFRKGATNPEYQNINAETQQVANANAVMLSDGTLRYESSIVNSNLFKTAAEIHVDDELEEAQRYLSSSHVVTASNQEVNTPEPDAGDDNIMIQIKPGVTLIVNAQIPIDNKIIQVIRELFV
jgi:hypothetical protein